VLRRLGNHQPLLNETAKSGGRQPKLFSPVAKFLKHLEKFGSSAKLFFLWDRSRRQG
jgi:hypothetical protein